MKNGKRARTNVRQSKFGCFKCKERRIKCDELKPSCYRCVRSQLACPGYPRGAPLGPRSGTSCQSAVSSTSCIRLNPSQASGRFHSLACAILNQCPRRGKGRLEIAFWAYIVPQLSHAIPSVRAAATAFGASYHECVLRSNHSPLGLDATKQYLQALRLVQLDLQGRPHGDVPCIIACLLLAFTEILRQNTNNALIHLHGAFTLIKSRFSEESASNSDTSQMLLVFKKLDLHIATFSFGRSPGLPLSISNSPGIFTSTPLDEVFFNILHCCYHFISTAVEYRYVNHRFIPRALLIEQGRHLATLRQWLSLSQPPSSPLSSHPNENEHTLVLRAQCLAAFIYTGTILEPYEAGYDNYSHCFQEILILAEQVLRQSGYDSPNDLSRNALEPFTPEMGIIHPIFLTGLKYRHPFWRRKAIDLLRRSGREGPWCGATEASVLTTVVKAEERLVNDPLCGSLPIENSSLDGTWSIPEGKRIHTCWVVRFLDQKLQHNKKERTTQQSSYQVAEVRLTKCKDIGGMLRAGESETSQDAWRDPSHWHSWIEHALVPEILAGLPGLG
ncbi:hypothetical protein NW767_014449 [Fusarium falciforme]|nr:hypothetical protein NW767_014449 [Fusarium falciforme]